MSEASEIKTTYTQRGLRRFEVAIRHKELHKYQVIRGDNRLVVMQQAQVKMSQWDEMWARKHEAEQKRQERQQHAQEVEEKKQLVVERTKEAQEALAVLDTVLSHTLGIDDTVDWESLKKHADYTKPQPTKPVPPEIFQKPQRSDAKYQIKLGFIDEFLDGLITSRRVERKKKVDARFKSELERWQKARDQVAAEHNDRVDKYREDMKAWEVDRATYLKERDQGNAAIDKRKEEYLKAQPQAIINYCDLVLTNSKYPDYFPQSYELDYNPETKLLLVDYQLPSGSDIPTVKEVKYVQARDDFVETQISQSQLNQIYDNLLYQIALRTIHELYEADKIGALATIVFNGFVDSVDPATGNEAHACVISLLANKEEFEEINLANVDPKACFKKLKGVGSSKLHSLTPIAPIVQMEREDNRFVDAWAVVDDLKEGDNLAAMDWESFEHLVREIFEKEFASAGGEVKVTRASRDGGIDAVAFDPDPIRGGKIVIQAKRYTNTVGVSAVRDLYGSMMNEGANKGILVTTSDYGPDAYEFAKGKPLTLLSGSNLLHLLEKHGHKAWIDLREAKKTLSESQID
ncbi:MAG: restriction endonuclease [Anaerolineae bacterium]|nr:restriction endonuclease [Anaerolineae bacterium]